MAAPERSPEFERLEVILRTLRPILRRRAPRPLSDIERRLKRLHERRWRIAVAGAQGNGKSSLVRALLASPADPEPPVPVSDREETRIPVLYRRGAKPKLWEVGTFGRRSQPGPIDEAAIRKRASADRRLRDRARYAGLDALEVELPGVALDDEIDLVDLPGVAGNLANVSKWATKNLLERGSQCVIFVLAPSSTISATEQEANLIRAFGSQMVRAIFVHNVWSGHDDDHDATERENMGFLQKHVESEVRYVRLDIRAAGEAARRGDATLVGPLLDALAPFYRGELCGLALDEAGRLRNLLDEVQRSVAVDQLGATGNAEAAQRAARAIQAEREKVRHALQDVIRLIHAEVDVTRRSVAKGVEQEAGSFERSLDEFVRDEKTLSQNVFEREVARRVGSLQRATKKTLEAEIEGLLGRVRERSREVLGRIDLEALPDTEVKFEAPRLTFGLERQILGAVKFAVGLGGAAAGAAAGAMLGAEGGALAGPLGFIAGGIAGALVGWLGSLALDETVGASITEKERRTMRDQLRASLAGTMAATLEAIEGALQRVERQLVGAVETFRDDREAVLLEQSRQTAAGGEILTKLQAERRALDEARRGLDALLATAAWRGL